MVKGLHTCKGGNGVFVNPVFKVAHKQVVAIDSGIAAETCQLMEVQVLNQNRPTSCLILFCAI
jgi:hypothetical protein